MILPPEDLIPAWIGSSSSWNLVDFAVLVSSAKSESAALGTYPISRPKHHNLSWHLVSDVLTWSADILGDDLQERFSIALSRLSPQQNALYVPLWMNDARREARQAALRGAAEATDAARDAAQRAEAALDNRCCGIDSQGQRCEKK